MSRPGTANSDLEAVQARIEALKEGLLESPPEQDDVRKLFTVVSYVDEVEVAVRALWGTLSTPAKMYDNALCSQTEYRTVILAILTVVGVPPTTLTTLAHRVQQLDSIGAEPIPYKTFKRRITTTIKTLWPQAGPYSAHLESGQPDPTRLLEHEQVGLLASQISDGGSLIASEDLKTFASRGIDCASLTGMCSSLIRPMGCEENGIIIIGDPCVGKTALGAAVAEALNAVHLEVVTLAYNEMQRGSELGGFIADQLREGSPLEMSLQAELISNEMQGAAVRARGFVFDDFPILPCSASGDLMLSKWLDWCNVKPNAVHVLSITAHDSTSLADEWKHLFSQKKRHLREISDTEASLRSEEDAKSAIEAAKLEKRAEIAALKEANPDAEVEELEEEEEVSEEDRAKNEAILLASRKRRTMYDLAALVHTGRMVWLKEGEGDDAREASATDSWEGDTPFLSPASHVELAASIESAVARGTFHEVSHIDSIEDKLSLLFNRYGCFKRAEAPYIPNLSQPEADLLTETEENIEASLMEVLAPQKITFSPVWGKLCPVTYDEGVAVEGTALLPCVMQATLYIFTSRERRAAFIVNPDAYLAAQPKMKNRSMMVLATKPNLMKTHFPANDASLADEALRRLDYACISLDEFHSTWKHYNEMEAGKMFDHVTKQRDLAQKLLEEEELAKTILKAQKKKKGADEKKKKKKGDKKEEKVEAEEADEVKETPDLAEEKELTVLDLKAKEVAAAAHLLKNDSSLLMDALTPDAAQLCYLQSLHLLPSTVVVLDDTPPGTEDEDPEEPPPEEEDPEGVEGGAPPEDTSDPSDLTNPKRYKQFMKDFLASLEQEDEGTPEEAAPTDDEKAEKAEVVPKLEDFYPKQPKKTVRVERINVADLSSVVEVLGVISKRLDVFVPKAVPAEGGEEEGETGGDPDEEDNTPVKDKRLTPGETAEARCGYSVKHCPVSLAADRSLVVGDPEISAIYEGKRWYFKSDVERTKFLEFPKKYSKKVCTLEEGLPPPAFWLVGTQVAETTPFCDSLEELFNVPRIDFRDIDGITERLKAVKKPCSEVQKAAGLLAERKAMEAEADRKQKEKEAILKRQEEDGNADEMPPELEEFEPEDPEVRAERILLSQIAILKHIIRAAPYTNSGHILSNVPTKDEHLDALRDSGIRPEIVIFANLDKDVYIRRRLAVELPARREVYSAKVKHRDESKAGAEQRKKERELYAWRRRNIGGEEAEEDGGEEEEEVVPVSEEELREELGAAYDEELAELEAVRAKATEFRSEVLSVDFATPPDATLSVAMLTLRRRLTYRTSLLCTPYLTTHQDADARIHTSRATLSAFGRNVCPVSHYIMQRKLSTLAKTLGTPPNRTSKFPVLAAQNVVFDMAEASVLDPNCKVEENGGGGKVEGDGEEEEEEAVEPEVEEGDDADDPEAAERARSAAVAANEAAVRERRGVLPYPVLFDGVAYYCANEENVLAFLDHPMRYVEEQLCTPLHVSCNPVLSLREDVPTAVHEIPVLIAIVGSKEDSSANTEDAGGLDGGAPVDVVKDGDEAQREFLRIRHAAAEPSVGEHIAHNLGLVCITKENLIQTFIEKDTTLADILLEKVLKKQDIPESLLVTLIFMRLAMSDVKTKGYVSKSSPLSSFHPFMVPIHHEFPFKYGSQY